MPTFVFEAMGTVGSVATHTPLNDAASAEIRAIFAEWEDRFSLYRPGSELCRINRRETLMTKASAPMRNVFERAHEWSERTGGAFTPYRADGSLDLNGIVKALTIHEAGLVLSRHDHHDWCFNMGGDVLTAGVDHHNSKTRPWTVGIVDPDDRLALLSQFECSDAKPAVATSGNRERGEHIWRTTDSGPRFCQVTVAAASIEIADVLATTILAGGVPQLNACTDFFDIDVLAAAEGGQLFATAAFRA